MTFNMRNVPYDMRMDRQDDKGERFKKQAVEAMTHHENILI